MARILIVEDDEAAVLAARLAFEEEASEIVVAGCYVDAERALADGHYDLIFLDLHFPYSATELHGSPGKVVMETLYGDTERFERAYDHLMSRDNSDVAAYDRPAPIGLHLIGLVVNTGASFVLTPQGSRHWGSKGYIRYFLQEALENDGFEVLLAKFGDTSFDKTKPGEWKWLVEHQMVSHRDDVYKWIENVKAVPLIAQLMGL